MPKYPMCSSAEPAMNPKPAHVTPPSTNAIPPLLPRLASRFQPAWAPPPRARGRARVDLCRRLQLRLDQCRLAALGGRDVDGVEGGRDEGFPEARAGLVTDFAREVARGEVREREQLHARLGGDPRGLQRGRVA